MSEAVRAKDALLRRVPDNRDMWMRKDGIVRPTSAAMKPHDDDQGLSVDLRRLLPDPADPTSVLAGYSGAGLAEFFARFARDLGLDVIHVPLPGNDAHANVVGFDTLEKPDRKRAQRELAKKAVWIQMPAGALAA